MYKRTGALILSGILATGVAGAVVMTPASAATSDNAVTSRLAAIKSALSGLVSDGTLSQSQADKVARTLDTKLPMRGRGGHGGPGGHFGAMGMLKAHEAAAKALGLTTAQLHTALEGGKSLADVAKDQKVTVAALVRVIVTAAEAQLATAVKDGTLTQAQADTMKSRLTARVTDRVNNIRPDRGPGRGMGGSGTSPSAPGTPGATSGGSSSAT